VCSIAFDLRLRLDIGWSGDRHWPVCPVSETAAHIALFTLVGIAGEDDLDAPDLAFGNAVLPPQPTLGIEAHANRPSNDLPEVAGQTERSAQRRVKNQPSPALSPEASRDLHCQLVSELEALDSSETLTKWAQRVLPLKNQLSTTDALIVEEAFSIKLNQLETGDVSPADQDANGRPPEQPGLGEPQVTVITKPVRERDRDH
jgi:hypothetical protein